MTESPNVPPHPDKLCSLPTIRTLTSDDEEFRDLCKGMGFVFTLELKLETPEVRYWFCTRSQGNGITGWNEGNVIMELLKPNEPGVGEFLPYKADDTSTMQRIAYMNRLAGDVDRLTKELAKHPESWELNKQLDAVIAEIGRVNEALGLHPPSPQQ